MANKQPDADKAPEKNGAGDQAEGAEAPAAGGGKLKAWIPLLANIIIMPALAVALTHFYILPKLNAASAPAKHGDGAEPAEAGGHGAPAHNPSSKNKVMIPLGGKILVNVAGTMGTRYLIVNITMVSNSNELKSMVEGRDAQLRDAASGILSLKTITDLEKPGVRNMIRTELISSFNDILGKNIITEIYLPEFAIQ